MELAAQRRAVADCCRRMEADGLVVGTAGNVSVRHGDLIAITPSGVEYGSLTPEQIGVHRLDGTPVDAPLPPTSEIAMHLAAYERPGTLAVVHTHAPAATAVSTLVDELPSIHYLAGTFGGGVRVARYATYGTPDLAANMVEALAGRTACLLGNHGTITVGGSLGEAYARTRTLEWLCDVWLRASAAGTPRVLPPDEIDRVAEKLRSYGPYAITDATPGPG